MSKKDDLLHPPHLVSGPRFGKRLLPLLDVIFLLLIFFLLLPQGTESSEKRRLRHLESELEETEREADFLKWRYGAHPPGKIKLRKTLEVVIEGNEAYYQGESGRAVPIDEMCERIEQEVRRKNANFVTVMARNGTVGSVFEMRDFLEEQHIPYILDGR